MAKQTIRLATPIKQMRQPGRYHEDCLSCSWVYCQHSQRLFRPLLRRNDISLTEKKKKLLEAHIYWSHHLHRFPTWCLKVRNSYPSFFFPSLALYWKDGDGVSIEASLSKERFFFFLLPRVQSLGLRLLLNCVQMLHQKDGSAGGRESHSNMSAINKNTNDSRIWTIVAELDPRIKTLYEIP